MITAFLLSVGAGLAAAVFLMFATAWRLRNGVVPRSRRYSTGVFVVILAVPLTLAIAMPDFKTAMVAWFGYAVGFAMSTVVTLPLGYVLARRLEQG